MRARVTTAAPIFCTIQELEALFADGRLTAEALAEACLDQIGKHDGGADGIRAIRQINPDLLHVARALDRERGQGIVRSRLHGVPVLLKDNIDMAGLASTSGSIALAHAMPLRDAAVTQRLRKAGALLLGKANLSEFSFEIRSRSSLGGDVRNPFDRRVTAGGSSGGTAAAIAAGFATAGIGTDTGGSIRIPASFNGIFGLRPSSGLIDGTGVAPLAPSTDTVGPMGRCVDDLAILLGVLTGTADRAWLPPTPPGRFAMRRASIGVLRQAFGENAEIAAVMQAALASMRERGARLIDPVAIDTALLPHGKPHIVDWEFGPAFDRYLATNFAAGTAPRSVGDILASGAYLDEYRTTLQRRAAVTRFDTPERHAILARHAALRQGLRALMEAHWLDAIIYPSSACLPESLGNPAGGWAAELAACSGMPALAIPAGRTGCGLPVGLELLGRTGEEARLLALGAELACDLAASRPPSLC